MPGGRPSLGPKLVDKLAGSAHAKKRARVILETIAGERSVAEACTELGIGSTAFTKIRDAALAAAVGSLEPKRMGRKPKVVTEQDERIRELEAEIKRLNRELILSGARERVAAAIPYLPERWAIGQWQQELAASKKAEAGGADVSPVPSETVEATPAAPVKQQTVSENDRPTKQRATPRPQTPREERLKRRQQKRTQQIEAAVEARSMPTNQKHDGRRRRQKTQRPEKKYTAQMERREMEAKARRSAVAAARALIADGEKLESIAEGLNLSVRTLKGWLTDWRRTRLAAVPRGRPVDPLPVEKRNEIISVMNQAGPDTGLTVFVGFFPGVPQSALWDLLSRYRELCARRQTKALWTLRWGRPGAVWAMDHAEPPSAIDGQYGHVLAVRDLASHCQLAWLPVEREDAWTTVRALDELFTEHGTPLVIKADRGPAFDCETMRAFLASRGVELLLSPPHWPRYNGSCEAGIGWMKVRTAHQAALGDRPGQWTSDDCEAARRQGNEIGRPWGKSRPTPSDVWSSRTPVAQQDRDDFQLEVAKWERTLSEGRAKREQRVLTAEDRKEIRREAISCALREQHYLEVRRGRVPSPVAA